MRIEFENISAVRFMYFTSSFQGGFAKCYELQDKETNHIYAGKIVPKSMLTKSHQKEKVHKLFLHSHCK